MSVIDCVGWGRMKWQDGVEIHWIEEMLTSKYPSLASCHVFMTFLPFAIAKLHGDIEICYQRELQSVITMDVCSACIVWVTVLTVLSMRQLVSWMQQYLAYLRCLACDCVTVWSVPTGGQPCEAIPTTNEGWVWVLSKGEECTSLGDDQAVFLELMM